MVRDDTKASAADKITARPAKKTAPTAGRRSVEARPARELAVETPPAVSVVIPVLNEQRDIGRVLDEVLRQRQPDGGFEVVVADGGSSDRTRDIVRSRCGRWANLFLVDNTRRLSSAGRNAGARAARGRYILFLDGHCSIPRDDYLIRVVELFRTTDAACLARAQPLQNLAEGRWAAAVAAARHSFLGHDPGSDIYGGDADYTDPRSAGAAYRREVVEVLGGYDERFDACEDVEFNHRVAQAGFRAYRHPDLSIDYRPRQSLGAFFRQMLRYGRGRARLMARHPAVLPLPLVAGSVAAVVLVALVVLGAWLPVAVLVAAAALLWAGAIVAASARVGGSMGHRMRVAAALASVHAGLVLGFWRGLLDFPRFRAARSNAVWTWSGTPLSSRGPDTLLAE
jgi:GT2 family glycosyltransferase